MNKAAYERRSTHKEDELCKYFFIFIGCFGISKESLSNGCSDLKCGFYFINT
jgi:hypothetical protein